MLNKNLFSIKRVKNKYSSNTNSRYSLCATKKKIYLKLQVANNLLPTKYICECDSQRYTINIYHFGITLCKRNYTHNN